MSDNKKKRTDKGFVPQKPPKVPKDPIELLKGSVGPLEPKVHKGYSPPRSPKPPHKNYKMPE